jgi:hypothetical protein
MQTSADSITIKAPLKQNHTEAFLSFISLASQWRRRRRIQIQLLKLETLNPI